MIVHLDDMGVPAHSTSPQRVEIISRGPGETQAVGRALGAQASPGDVILLTGGLGAGKTCLTQGILWGLGADEYARSPTFVLVSQYQARLTLYHIDLYRLDSIEVIASLGLEELLLGEGVCVVEWAEKAPEIYPPQHMTVRIEYVDDGTRRLMMAATSDRYAEALEAAKAATVKR